MATRQKTWRSFREKTNPPAQTPVAVGTLIQERPQAEQGAPQEDAADEDDVVNLRRGVHLLSAGVGAILVLSSVKALVRRSPYDFYRELIHPTGRCGQASTLNLLYLALFGAAIVFAELNLFRVRVWAHFLSYRTGRGGLLFICATLAGTNNALSRTPVPLLCFIGSFANVALSLYLRRKLRGKNSRDKTGALPAPVTTKKQAGRSDLL